MLPEKIRAFIAIRVRLEVARAIEDLIARLRADGDGIKWVAPANLHLTLKFLGPAVPLEKIQLLDSQLEKIAAETRSFELPAIGVGGFPNLKHPNVLWVGLRSEVLGDSSHGWTTQPRDAVSIVSSAPSMAI